MTRIVTPSQLDAVVVTQNRLSFGFSYSVPQEVLQYFLPGGTGGLDRVTFSLVALGSRLEPCSILSTNTTSCVMIPLDSWGHL